LRGLWVAVVACVFVVTGCGGAGSGGSSFDETDAGFQYIDATVPTLLSDATTPPEATVNCTPRTCALAGTNCGPVADGCGGLLQCGTCPAPSTCGGGGTPSVCGGTAACVPATCASLNVNCGEQGDGCGGTFDCGNCTAPQTCGGGGDAGAASTCGGSAACIPIAACPVGMNCGAVADGCGGLVQCGSAAGCPANTTCGGGGQGNVCGAVNVLPDGGIVDGGLDLCTPLTQAEACGGTGKNCGITSDGCNGSYFCGTCTAPETCGGGGDAGAFSVCGGNAGCVPVTACPAQMNCGVIGDGCGGAVYCAPDGGTCGAGETCGGGGQSNVCGAKNILPDGGFIDGGLNLCMPLTQSEACNGKNCGITSDGCNGSYFCGTCTAPETCGGGGDAGAYSVCGGNSGCVPLTACSAGMNCGVISNGCGGEVFCGNDAGTCPVNELCGGGGQSNVCGAKNILPDGGIIDGGLNACVPIPQGTACAGIGCGQTGDGCGNLYNCGVVCTGQDTCGGGGVPFQCGHPACVPITTCPAGVQCGTVGDGCGGTVTCPTCTSGTCGGSGTPNKCGSPTCVPATSCPPGKNCGPWADGCGGTIPSCGTCTISGQICGGQTASECGPPPCAPLTACPTGKNCGQWPDGCGGTLTCGNATGTCTPPQYCGGGGPSVCGENLPDGGACTGVACNQVSCDGGTTSITGTIYDPAGADGLYNVVIYVPQSRPAKFSHGPSCDSCASLYTGDPLVAAVTNADGVFTLTDVPVMANLPIVIQIGKWRRQMAITQTIAKCGSTTITDKTLLLPGQENAAPADAGATGPWQGPGTIDDLPEIAISTGSADTMECLFRRIGVAAGEYTAGGGGTGHIHVFQGSANGGTASPTMTGAPFGKNSLWDQYSDMSPYDIVVLSCEGEETIGAAGGGLSSAERETLFEYANNGGRTFASHFHYSWFNKAEADGGGFGAENLAKWTAGANPMTDQNNKQEVNTNIITTLNDGGTFTRGVALETFLGNTPDVLGKNPLGPGDGTTSTQLNIHAAKHNADVSSTNTASQPWLVADNNASVPGATQYFTWDTPVGGVNEGDAGVNYCGRVVFSDLHVGSAVSPADYNGTTNTKTPTGCSASALSPQEKALEFMLFDLSSCVSGGSNLPVLQCVPLTACPAQYTCDSYPNNCGGLINCGTCPTGSACVGGACQACTPATTCPSSQKCGAWPDGCGGTITSCGLCATGDSCINGACVNGCTKETCATQHLACGAAGDGCGGTIDGGCGPCQAGTSCEETGDAGGTSCVTAPCTKVSCSTLHLSCGKAGDGCGGTQDCGDCTAPDVCGGGGVNGVCGLSDANLCVPLTCGDQNIQCGPAGDGCGNLIANCGTCATGQTCGGGGSPGICGSPNCTPLTCNGLNLHCGQTGDGCGGILNCGTCTGQQSCGGGGVNGVCGEGDANLCTPLTCGDQGILCGPAGDGCGGLWADCGDCATGQSCGGGGTPGACGSPICTPLTCGELFLSCGTTGDGCGGTLQCGQCTSPQTCGGGGVTGVCGLADAIACSPFSCPASQKCGDIGDGCGGTVDCGDCAPPQTCGGGGTAGVCGAPDCTPKSCTDLGATCGVVADGCGGLTANCGTCNGSTTCGGGGTANQCGSPDCTPRNCQQAGANCGPVADGCGGIIQCGTCITPDTCGGGGTSSVCGAGSIH
jgi:hypothetical protein